jgi:hypothetical protein
MESVKLYRFSPIQDKAQLLEAIEYVHFACHKLCKQSFGTYFPNSGNVGIFSHYDDEYDRLLAIRKELTKPSDDPKQKYFELHEPIVVSAKGDVPETAYTHLYIRHPDPYRYQVGDIDFYLELDRYKELKRTAAEGEKLKGARVYPREALDMIELYDPDIDALGYVTQTHYT